MERSRVGERVDEVRVAHAANRKDAATSLAGGARCFAKFAPRALSFNIYSFSRCGTSRHIRSGLRPPIGACWRRMRKLPAVEEARALMSEGREWGTWKWLFEKSRVRTAA